MGTICEERSISHGDTQTGWTEGGPCSAYPKKHCLPLPSISLLALGGVQPRGHLEILLSSTWGVGRSVGCEVWGAGHRKWGAGSGALSTACRARAACGQRCPGRAMVFSCQHDALCSLKLSFYLGRVKSSKGAGFLCVFFFFFYFYCFDTLMIIFSLIFPPSRLLLCG